MEDGSINREQECGEERGRKRERAKERQLKLQLERQRVQNTKDQSIFTVTGAASLRFTSLLFAFLLFCCTFLFMRTRLFLCFYPLLQALSLYGFNCPFGVIAVVHVLICWTAERSCR